MRALKRYGSSVALLVAMAISLAGCVHIDRGVTLKSDGSGTYTLTMGFIDQLITSPTDTTSTAMNTFGAQIKQAGGSFREYEDSGYTYWAYTEPFSNIAALNADLKSMPQFSSNQAEGSVNASTSLGSGDSITFTEQQGFPSNTFHVTGHLSLALPPGTNTNSGGVDLSSYLKQMRDSFAVTMPGSVTAHTGGTVNGNTVTYLIHGGEQTAIDVTGSSLNLGAFIPIGAAVIVLLLVIAGFLIWRARRGKPSQPAVAAYGATASTPSAPTWTSGAPPQTYAPSTPPESYPPSTPSTPPQSPWPQ